MAIKETRDDPIEEVVVVGRREFGDESNSGGGAASRPGGGAGTGGTGMGGGGGGGGGAKQNDWYNEDGSYSHSTPPGTDRDGKPANTGGEPTTSTNPETGSEIPAPPWWNDGLKILTGGGSNISPGVLDELLDLINKTEGSNNAVLVNTGGAETGEEVSDLIDHVVITDTAQTDGGGGDTGGGGGGASGGASGGGSLGDSPDSTLILGDGTKTLIEQIEEAIASEDDPTTVEDLQKVLDDLGGAGNNEMVLGDDVESSGEEAAEEGGNIDFGIDLRDYNEGDDDATIPNSTVVDDDVVDETPSESDPTLGEGDGEGVGVEEGVDVGAGDGTGDGEGAGTGDGVGDGTDSGGTGDGTGTGMGDGAGPGEGDGEGLDVEEPNPMLEPPPVNSPGSERFTIRGYFGWADNNVEDQKKRNPWTYRRRA